MVGQPARAGALSITRHITAERLSARGRETGRQADQQGASDL